MNPESIRRDGVAESCEPDGVVDDFDLTMHFAIMVASGDFCAWPGTQLRALRDSIDLLL